jgi:hypothetical protein
MTEQTERNWDLRHPVDDLDEALRHLRRPFEPAAVKWKVQAVVAQGKAAIVVAHIDARLVVERLNAVVGALWYDEYTLLDKGTAECALTLYGVTRRDVGVANEPKALRSDALKRAGVKFGIGVSIYALSQVYMEVGADPHQLRTRKQRKKVGDSWETVQVPDLDATSRSWLADRYGAWLTASGRGQEVFGQPLGHGDEPDAQGVDDEPAQPNEDEAPVVPSEEAEAAHREALEGAKP